MMDQNKDAAVYFRQARLFATVLLVVFPIFYLVIAFFVTSEKYAGEGANRMVLYMLMAVAMIQPTAWFLFRKMQVSNYRKSPQAKMSPGQLYLTLEIMKLALIEAVYIYGLVMIIIVGNFENLIYFYIIGIIWSVALWPRRSVMETFMKNLEEHGT